MNVAIIDVGSNNIKLEIHHVDPQGNHELLLREKVPARLGHQVFITRKLAKANAEQAIEGLKYFQKLIKSKNCKKVIAIGTAALREAAAESFLKQVRKKTGIAIQVISGVEEARLIYQGVRATTKLGSEKFLLIDIGGGSTELTIADESKPYFIQSLRLGTVRLKELFESDDKELSRKLSEKYIEKVLDPFKKEILSFGVHKAILTGGTARNVCSMLEAKESGCEEDRGLPAMKTGKVVAIAEEINKLDTEALRNYPGLDPQRADIISEGALLLSKILSELQIQTALVSPRGLRDGALVDYIQRKLQRKFYRTKQKDIRKTSILYLCEKYRVNKKHAKQCANLAVNLFDELNANGNYDAAHKDILYGAAYLHDIGLFINYSEHHKHSYYIISNTDIPGFSAPETHLMALVCRYHRKAIPKKTHVEFAEKKESEQEVVRFLAGILRLSIALDKSAHSLVESVRLIEEEKDHLVLELDSHGKDLSLELWDADRKKKLLEKVLQKEIRFTVSAKHGKATPGT